MVKPWRVIESGRLDVQAVMDKDADLLAALNDASSPILHFYEWDRPCLTFGYFIDPAHHVKLDQLEKHGLTMGRRPTGGGVIFHLADLAFSVLLPAHHPGFSMNTLENYAFINLRVARAIARFSSEMVRPRLFEEGPACLNRKCSPFCMVKPTQYDLIVEGRKMGGAAQRRTKKGLLHQTSLTLGYPPYELIKELLHSGEDVIEAMKENTAPLLFSGGNIALQDVRCRIRKELIDVFNIA